MQGLIYPTRFLNTIFQLQKLVSKTHRAKVSTADSLYVVEGKITLQFRCCCAEELVFILNIIRNISKNWIWINVYFQSIWWLSELGEIHLTLTFPGKQCVFEAQKAIQITVYTKWRKTVQNTFKCSYRPLETNLRVSMNHWSKLHVADSHWFSDWILEVSQPLSYSMKMHIKIQFYNPIVERTTQFKKFGLIINHAKYIFDFTPG